MKLICGTVGRMMSQNQENTKRDLTVLYLYYFSVLYTT